jgi:hypothetical protein
LPQTTKTTSEVLQELWELLQDYATQETIAPLKNLGRYLGLGLAGSLLFGIGVVFLGLAILRVLQSELSIFDDTWSWVPYVAAVVFMALVVGGAGAAATRSPESTDVP